ncbi:GTPase Era, mitochondrial [Pseudolycoriella hygida]|uniref:GTPase Era, mitochondrial n=1 Tax=Pseudolycoriella hygida TaxID=35572 RepID=A0A9Q0S754_9DIPT|nr:GTPase Era, mitochondrial [Pseudolycoriella hygida]
MSKLVNFIYWLRIFNALSEQKITMKKSAIFVIFNQSRHFSNVCRGLRTRPLEKLESKPNENEKVVKIAVIGPPNAGKSTFINKLLNHRICATSPKVHTTRTFAKAIGIRNNSQVILFDTPGLVTEKEMKKFNLSHEFVSACRHSIQHSDLIAVIHDVSKSWTRNHLHSTVLNTLKEYTNIPSILVLNKVDLIKSKRILLDVTKSLTQNTLLPKGFRRPKDLSKEEHQVKNDNEEVVGWPHFSNVFMVSSADGDGMSEVMKYILRHGKTKKWEYEKNEYTDLPPEELIVQSVRARLLEALPQEMPYLLKCEIEYFSEEKGHVFTSVLVTCPTERIEHLVCGTEKERIKHITELATSDLVQTFQKPVSLTVSLNSQRKKIK